MFYKFWKNMIGHLEDDYKTNHIDAVHLLNKSDILKFFMKFENIFCYINFFCGPLLTLFIKLF